MTHEGEPHGNGLASRLNWLRAGVLGANDGIVSVAAVVVGVAAATTELAPILIAGAAALVGGAISMGLGEYVSVSSQRDTQRALIEKEKRELEELPDEELEELIGLYEGRGLSRETAEQVATELTSMAHSLPTSRPNSALTRKTSSAPGKRREHPLSHSSSEPRCPCSQSCCRPRTCACP